MNPSPSPSSPRREAPSPGPGEHVIARPRPRRSPALRLASVFVAATLATGLVGAIPAVGGGQAATSEWLQWGGPNRDFIVASGSLAESWPSDGPQVLWRRPLGPGHSAILYDDGILYTMYREGGGGPQGPWADEENVVALDADSGDTVWEFRYASPINGTDLNTDFGSGPHSTPLIVGDRLFAIGTDKQFHALDKRSGELLWRHDLVADLGAPPLLTRPVVTAGYGCSPIAYEETVICAVGGDGQSMIAFRQRDGEVVWRGGDFLVSNAPPALIDVDGQTQLVVVGGDAVHGMDPDDGVVLWSVPHDPGNDLNMTAGLWGDNGVLFVSSAYASGSRAIRLTRDGDTTRADEIWYDDGIQLMFLNTLRRGAWVYGTEGAFGPKLMTAINVETGEQAFRERGFGHASMLYADDKFIIMDEDGELVLARMSPDGFEILARAALFDTVSWTVPTLIGTTLYARDREQIVAVDLGRPVP